MPRGSGWYVCVLGPVEVYSSGGDLCRFRTRKTGLLIALLALRAEPRLRRDTLAELLWPESTPEAARQSLRMALMDARRVTSPEFLITDRDSVTLQSDSFSLDLHDLQRTPGAGTLAALSSIRGPALEGQEGDIVVSERSRIHDMIAQLAVESCRTAPSQEAIETLKRLLTLVGFREDLYVAMMRAFIDLGSMSAALATFETLEEELSERWGESPSQEAVDLIQNAPQAATQDLQARKSLFSEGIIGRDQLFHDLLASLHALPEGGVLSLVATGGAGKTTLAQALMRAHAGVQWFVDLKAETTPQGAMRAIQLALGIGLGEPSEAPSSIARVLNASEGLLVLDNLEQLLPQSASVLSQVISSTRTTKIVATSRIPIGHESEVVHNLPLLRLPNLTAPDEGATLASSTELFLHRAKRAQPSFHLHEGNRASVDTLCHRLDGLPLAIILAAARVTVMTPSEILQQIQGSMKALDAEPGRTDRHSSLHRTLAWSFDLLPASAKLALLSLSLWEGPMDRTTANRLVEPFAPLDSLEELVHCSLVQAETSGNVAQFWMLETIRAVAKEWLLESDDCPRIAENFVNILSDMLAHVRTEKQVSHDTRARNILRLSNNLLAGMDLSSRVSASPSVAIEIALQLVDYVHPLGLGTRMIPIIDRLVESHLDHLPGRIAGLLIALQTQLTLNHGDPSSLVVKLQHAAELAKEDERALVRIKTSLATALKSVGRYEDARELLEWVLDHTTSDQHSERARALYVSGQNEVCLGAYDTSLKFHKQALVEARKGSETNFVVRILFDLGSELARQGEQEESMTLFEEALELCERIDSRRLEGLTRWQLGDALLSCGKPKEALVQLVEAMRLCRSTDFVNAQKWIFLKTAEALAKLEHDTLAIQFLAKGIQARMDENRPLAAYEVEDVNRIEELLKTRVNETRYARFQAEAETMTWESLWEAADNVASDLN